jgi:hypothetical protein
MGMACTAQEELGVGSLIVLNEKEPPHFKEL